MIVGQDDVRWLVQPSWMRVQALHCRAAGIWTACPLSLNERYVMSDPRNTRSVSKSSKDIAATLVADESQARRNEHTEADEHIRLAAYKIAPQRGDKPGDDLGAWLRLVGEYRDRSRDPLLRGEMRHEPPGR